jgi:hypothetical protein
VLKCFVASKVLERGDQNIVTSKVLKIDDEKCFVTSKVMKIGDGKCFVTSKFRENGN